MPRCRSSRLRRPSVQPMFASGQTVPAGTYVSLEDGHFVRVVSNSELPAGPVLPMFYVRLSDSPDYLVPVSLADAA